MTYDPAWRTGVGAGRALVDSCSAPVFTFAPIKTRLWSSLAALDAMPKIMTVVAPPGYGKTVLLSQSHDQFVERRILCRWIGLDDRDSSFERLLTLMEKAIEIGGDGHSVVPLRLTDSTDRIENLLRFLSETVETRIIFIDNIDCCTDRGVDRLLNALVFNSPARVKLVVSSSSGPVPFNASRARLELNLHSLCAADLTFDRASISVMFSQVGISNIDAQTLDAIVEKTEGWPAAVRLLQLTVDTENSLQRGIHLLSGDNVHISDILSRRLMQSFDEDLVSFLYEISGLRHFSVDLALAATSNVKAPYWIQFLVDRNIMIVPVGHKRCWFRFHNLFRQFLQDEAMRHGYEARLRDVHKAASLWLMKRGDHQSALELAIRAKELNLVTDLMEKNACSLVRDHGETSTFISWIHQAEQIGAPRGIQACFWYIWALMFERRYDVANTELAAVKAQLAERGNKTFPSDLHAKHGLAEIMVGVHIDALDAIRDDAELWLQTYPDAEPFEVAAAAGALFVAKIASHEYSAARRVLRTAQAAVARVSSEYGRCWVEALSGLIEILQGDPALAERELGEVEARARANIGPTASIVAIVSIVRARALHELGRFDEAELIVANNLRRASKNGVLDTTWAGIEVLLPSAVRGDGLLSLDELKSIVKEYPKRLAILTELNIIQELIIQERAEEALTRACDIGWNPGSGWGRDLMDTTTRMEQSAARVTAISLFISSGHLARAVELLDEEMQLAKKTGRRRAQIDLHLLSAAVQLRSTTRNAALRAFSRAIATAAKRDIYLPFLSRQILVRHLIEDLRPKQLGLTNWAEISTLSEISRLLGISPTTSTSNDLDDPLPDSPTPREIELLTLLNAGLDNAQIAGRLSLSVRTIKWHLSNLYCKLGVKNRSSAVAKSRALRLL